jgi:hypothetical protein
MKQDCLTHISRKCVNGARCNLLYLHKSILSNEWYNEDMQKIATKIFIGASVAFGVFGILSILTSSPDGIDAHGSPLNHVLMKLLMISVFVILPSFALSVAGRFFNNKH